MNAIELTFKEEILEGIPAILPKKMAYDPSYNHAPKRKSILSAEETKLALKNALRYFDKKHHNVLIEEFKNELNTYGRIYMYRFRPIHKIVARPIEDYPANSTQAAAIMLMIQNNLVLSSLPNHQASLPSQMKLYRLKYQPFYFFHRNIFFL